MIFQRHFCFFFHNLRRLRYPLGLWQITWCPLEYFFTINCVFRVLKRKKLHKKAVLNRSRERMAFGEISSMKNKKLFSPFSLSLSLALSLLVCLFVSLSNSLYVYLSPSLLKLKLLILLPKNVIYQPQISKLD